MRHKHGVALYLGPLFHREGLARYRVPGFLSYNWRMHMQWLPSPHTRGPGGKANVIATVRFVPWKKHSWTNDGGTSVLRYMYVVLRAYNFF